MRGLALQLVDDILENLLWPVEKADQPEEIRLEVDLAKVIKQAWDEQTVAALGQAVRLLRAGKGALTPNDVTAMLTILETMLGPGMAALTQEDLLRFVTSAYTLGRKKTVKTLGVSPNWAQIDDWSISVSQRHGVYWLRTYYTRELGQKVANTAEDLVFRQGLGRADLADELKKRLGNEWWAEGYQYWDVLASSVIQRTRNLAIVNTLEAAEVTTYEILAMMDERTCPICSRMDGKRFEVSQAVQLRDRILTAQSPEDVKMISPWISATKENLAILDRGDPKEIASRGWQMPPFHGRCRCTVVVVGFRDEQTAPAPRAWTNYINPEWQKRAEAYQKGAIRRRAKSRRMTVDEFKAATDKHIQDLIGQAEVRKRIRREDLKKVLRDGRFKSQFETGSSDGLYDPRVRAYMEENVYGFPPNGDPKKRPIYGYLGGKDDLKRRLVANYGEVIVHFKPSVHDRTTFNFGDSLNESEAGVEPRFAPEPLLKPSWKAGVYDSIYSEEPLDWETIDPVWNYVEIQIHGGVSVQDIDRITFEIGNEPDQELQDLLKRNGIRWAVKRKDEDL